MCLENKGLTNNTSKIFVGWEKYLKELVNRYDTDLVISRQDDAQLTQHACDKMKTRRITTGQLRYVLTHGFKLEQIQKTTKKNIFKFRVGGQDMDKVKITIVLILGQTGYKIITCF